MTPSELALFAFTACNTLRVVAYVPQLLKIARDNGGASAISYSTWGLFGASHLSTVAYAIAVLGDWRLAFIFTANAAACGAIVGLTFYKRLRFVARPLVLDGPHADAACCAGSASSPSPSAASARDRGRENAKVAIFPAERRRSAGGTL